MAKKFSNWFSSHTNQIPIRYGFNVETASISYRIAAAPYWTVRGALRWRAAQNNFRCAARARFAPRRVNSSLAQNEQRMSNLRKIEISEDLQGKTGAPRCLTVPTATTKDSFSVCNRLQFLAFHLIY
ncbi:hypothetical protein ACODYM_11195 [Burkholderia gladioli]|uniref:hypothetical protein n=1 Tax=Burkholderia gladioli TaxID=28095 RepID=UPI003B50BDEE